MKRVFRQLRESELALLMHKLSNSLGHMPLLTGTDA